MERSIALMRSHCHQPLSLGDLAGTALISPYHFIRVFRQVTGITPGRFLTGVRMHHAKRLLLTTPLSVTEVCLQVGYDSLGSFTSHFTRLVGTPPGRFRRLAEAATLPLERAGDAWTDLSAPAAGATVSGRIHGGERLMRRAYVGLFRTPVPAEPPTACCVASSTGAFRLSGVPDGHYYLLALGDTGPYDVVRCLAPDPPTCLVGGAPSGLQVCGRQVTGCTDITLRGMQLTDPPFLLALPLLRTLSEKADPDRPPMRSRANPPASPFSPPPGTKPAGPAP